MDSLIGTGDTYFNSLGQERTEVTFVEMEDGPVLRKGKKGAFVCPQMAPFETMDAGQMEKKARLLAERPADWITVKYVDEPYRVRVETAHAKICFAKDGSMESFMTGILTVNGRMVRFTNCTFIRICRVFMTHGIFCRTTKRKSLRSL